MDRRALLQTLVVAAASLTTSAIDVFATDDLVMRFQQRYQGLKSVRCSFSGSGNQRGTLAAVRGGKYRLSMNDRIIVSDGTSIYNASPSAKTVIINRFNPKATDVSIERVFFELLTVYRATVQSADGVQRTLRLVPPASSAVVYGVRELSVIVNASTLAISRCTATTDSGQFTFAITDLKLNTSLPASTFVYTPASGWEVIDLR